MSEFLSSRSSTSAKLYDHIILDLPSTPSHLRAASAALASNGTLVVFCPSVTQIAQCVAVIREQGLPLAYSTVLELGQGMVGGKQWDVRMAKVRKPDQERERGAGAKGKPDVVEEERTRSQRMRATLAEWLMRGLDGKSNGAPRTEQSEKSEPQDRWEMVARPSVGHRVAGGGFLGVWKKKRIDEDNQK